MDDIKKKVAQRIRTLREAKGMKQETLAWTAEVDRTYMNHIELGERNISVTTLAKILTALEISWLDFFKEIESA
ncbi:MAG: helix-turn-helix transcriptional regulator [Bacteroidetes bacterium]|nr:helix-turn-helix transcriptional regulator [Bacteroidota bacterium]